MLPGDDRREWDRIRRSWARHGIRCSLRRRAAVLWFTPKYGSPTDAVEVPVSPGDWTATRSILQDACDSLMKRPTKPVAGEVVTGTVCDPQIQQRYPQLWEHLTAVAYDDGSRRETSTLLLFMQDGSLKGMLRDKDGERCLWVAARSLIGVLEALEGQLGDDMADWRPDRKAKGESAPRGKR